jgi:hypothetical protein
MATGSARPTCTAEAAKHAALHLGQRVESMPRLLVDATNAYVYGDGGTPIEQVALTSGDGSYLAADCLGSVRGVVSASGSLSACDGVLRMGQPADLSTD